MFSLKRRKDAFRLLFPKEFIPEEINKKYTRILKSAKSFYTRPIDFLNETIQKVEVLGFQNATTQQQQITRGVPLRDANRLEQNNFAHPAADINYRSPDSILKLLDRTLNVEFRHTLGNVNYFLLLESFIYQFTRDSIKEPNYNFRIDILNQNGAAYSSIYLYQPLFNGIDMLSFDSGSTIAQAESFKCEFKYNNFDYQFIETDPLTEQVDFDEYLEGIGQQRPWNDPKQPGHKNRHRWPRWRPDSPWENLPGNFPYDPNVPEGDDDDDQVIFDDDGGGVLEDIVHHKRKHSKRKVYKRKPNPGDPNDPNNPNNPNNKNKKAANLSFDVVNIYGTVGKNIAEPKLNNPNKLDVLYYSSNESIAEVNHLTGKLELKKSGTVSIVAKSNETEKYYAGSAFYYIIVNEDFSAVDPTKKKFANLSFDKSYCSVKQNEDFEEPKLINPNNLEVLYYSFDDSIANVNHITGKVTLVAPGTTSILAKSQENEEYYADSAFYSLTIYKAGGSGGSTDPDDPNNPNNKNKKSAELSFPGLSYSTKIGEIFKEPMLNNPHQLNVRYYSFDNYIANVNQITGKVDLINPGSTTIIAKSLEDDEYYSGDASYKLIIDKADSSGGSTDPDDPNNPDNPKNNRKYPEISFDSLLYNTKIDEDFEEPILRNPNGLEIIYSTIDNGVANIDSKTGEIELLKVGTTIIVANSIETDEFYPGTASYMLNVENSSQGSGDGSGNGNGGNNDEDDDNNGKDKNPDPGSSFEDAADSRYEYSRGLAENEKFLFYPYTEENAKLLAKFGSSTEYGKLVNNSQTLVDENGNPIEGSDEDSETFAKWQELDFSKFKNSKNTE
ncbi:MAG: hypothetical protein J1F35_03275 [Erysipelotrichales bacterium]|nr:hypothetical protein [Erysipelotrichales bacterium]